MERDSADSVFRMPEDLVASCLIKLEPASATANKVL